jgi:hypothetical protein
MTTLAASLACAILAIAATAAAAAPREVLVTGTRVHVGDVIPGADAATAAVDVGPSPTAGGSRLVTRAEIVAALGAKQLAAPTTMPDAVRVVRKARHLLPADFELLVRTAVAAKPLGRGVTLSAVRVLHPIDVADGWARVDVDVPRAPKHAGLFTTTAIASFYAAESDVTARVPVPVELTVSPEGASYDTPRGAAVTLIVRRGAVEVHAAAVTMADADVGDQVPVQLRQSTRVLRARLTTTDEAVAIEDGQ